MTDLVERLRSFVATWPKSSRRFYSRQVDAITEAADEIERLRARVAELEAALENAQRHIDFFDPVTKCARCGIENRQTGMVPDEGDEWECFECWERLNAKERAERAAHMKEAEQ